MLKIHDLQIHPATKKGIINQDIFLCGHFLKGLTEFERWSSQMTQISAETGKS